MSWLSDLLGRGSEPRSLHSRLTLEDENGDPLQPQDVTDESDVRGVFVELDDGGQLEVRRVFGSWECVSCDSCSHADRVLEVIDEWVGYNQRDGTSGK